MSRRVAASCFSPRLTRMHSQYFSFSTWAVNPSLHLEELRVSPSTRRRGASEALLRPLGAVAEEKDVQA